VLAAESRPLADIRLGVDQPKSVSGVQAIQIRVGERLHPQPAAAAPARARGHANAPTSSARSGTRTWALRRLAFLSCCLLSTAAHAQTPMGGGLINYARNIILFLGVASVVVALVAAVFKPELVKSAVWAAVILTVIFFILRNTAALQSAVAGG
jgi:hypothetical protein